MKYNYGQQTWQTYVLNLSNNRVRRFFIFPSFISSKLSTELFAKIPLAWGSLLSLPYSLSSQALTAHTSQEIQGSVPYLTFDGGQTKATSTDMLLSIKLQDGRVITPSTNTSSATNPISLPYVSSTLGNIDTLIPSSVSSVSFSDLIHRYHYWGG
ncbi:hypothetical protein [Gilliamella sp. App6-5]|uniref:hypothetical protein n=1 Tax=Gilliamella sp. App6-5 TaxID=3120232 RepID=UPI0011475654|nr:hypothetical protein [Gilliamella apicola]